MALTIYGSPRSRTMRVLWMAAELGLEYRHVPLAWDDPALKSPELLALNPSGAIPFIVDGEARLSESLAINLYLAKTYGAAGPAPLYPEDESQAWRWSLWAQGHLEPWLQRDLRTAPLHEAAGALMIGQAKLGLAQLERRLAERAWLAADHFTVADLNVCAVLSPSRSERVDMAAYPFVRAWLARGYGRPAAIEVRRRFAA